MNLDKLIVSGQSFGAATALRVAKNDKRAKCVLTMDPWLMPIHKEINEGRFADFPHQQPAFLLNTFKFHEIQKEHFKFDSQQVFENLKRKCIKTDIVDDIIIDKAYHHHQNDCIILIGLELELPGFKRSKFKEVPRSNSKTNSIVQLHSWLWLSFLHRTGFHNGTFKA